MVSKQIHSKQYRSAYRTLKALVKGLVAVILLVILCLFCITLIFTYSARPKDPPRATASITEIGVPFAGSSSLAAPPFHLSFSPELFNKPSSEFRPWIRWWWPGDAVETKEIDSELSQLEQAGFAGVEIQSFARGLIASANQAYLGFDTPSFYQHLVDAMDAAKRHHLEVDLTVGSGYPTALPEIAPEDSLMTLMYGTLEIHGARALQQHIPEPTPTFWYKALSTAGIWKRRTLIDFYPSTAKPLATVAYRVKARHLKADLLAIGRQPKLDSSSVVDLSADVDAQGMIHWNSPPGEWLVITFYAGPSGTHPFPGPALKDPGHVVDFFSPTKTLALDNYLFGPRTGLPYYFGSPMRGIFADSFELQVERHVVPDILEQFISRRGYDLTPHLAALPVSGADNWYLNIAGATRHPAFRLGDQDKLVRHDYDLTVSDLFIERYIKPNTRWAQSHGLRFRVQPYGLNIDIIQAAEESDLPETEVLYGGGSEMFLKLVTSGAHLGGRNLVSAEAFDHPGAGEEMSPTALKAEADRLFAAGINQIVYHGYSYAVHSPGVDSIGWYPFAAKKKAYQISTNFAKTIGSTELKIFNLYVARAQYLLRLGKPHADVLLYYPFLGFPNDYSVLSTHREFGFNGLLPNLQSPSLRSPVPHVLAPLFVSPDKDEVTWLDHTWTIIHELERRGISWDWANDKAIQSADIKDHKTVVSGQEYSSVLFVDTPTLPRETSQSLQRLSAAGGRIHFIGSATGDGQGATADMTAVLEEVSVLRDFEVTTSSDAVRRIDRELNRSSTLTLLLNESDKPAALKVTALSGEWSWLDAANGTVTPALPVQNELSWTIAPHSTIFLMHRGPHLKPYPPRNNTSMPQ